MMTAATCARVLLAMSVPLACAERAHANVVFVDADGLVGGDGSSWDQAFVDLQDALALANADPTISEVWVAEGTYVPDQGTGDRALSFDLVNGVAVYGGFDGTEEALEERDPDGHVTTLSGDLDGDDQPGFVNVEENSYHVVDARNASLGVVLDGFTITGGNADGACCVHDRGGGVLAQFGLAELRDCQLRWNRAVYGGAIYYERLAPLVDQCRFESNEAEIGGAIYARLSSPSMSDTVFDFNTAVHGGAIMFDGGSPSLTACHLTANRALFGGGIAATDRASLDITACHFESNEAFSDTDVEGGAIRIEQSALTVTESVFLDNTAFAPPQTNAFGSGAAIYAAEGSVSIAGSEFREGVAEGGGGVTCIDCDVLVDASLFVSNSASFRGGAFAASGGSLSMTASTFSQNHADDWAGAVSILGATAVEVSGCSFTSNVSDDEGGALYMDGGFPKAYVVANCTFQGNTARWGGAIASLSFSDVSQCIFDGNIATTEGGAVWVCQRRTTMTDSHLAGNQALNGEGGAMFLFDSDLVLSRCTIALNTAAGDGGGIHITGGDLDVDNTIFVANTGVQGGAVYASANGHAFINCTVAANVGTGSTGGAFWHGGAPEITNSIFWGNDGAAEGQDAQLLVASMNGDVNYCCVGSCCRVRWCGQPQQRPRLRDAARRWR